MKFIVLGKPLGQNAVYKRGRGRRLYMTPEGKAWIERVQFIAKYARPAGWRLDGLYELELVSYFRNNLADCDGPVKLTLDALQGVLYDNDRQVSDYTARKRLDSGNPRLEVTIQLAPNVGEVK